MNKITNQLLEDGCLFLTQTNNCTDEEQFYELIRQFSQNLISLNLSTIELKFMANFFYPSYHKPIVKEEIGVISDNYSCCGCYSSNPLEDEIEKTIPIDIPGKYASALNKILLENLKIKLKAKRLDLVIESAEKLKNTIKARDKFYQEINKIDNPKPWWKIWGFKF
jgi:hypothetical protein